MGAFFRVFMPVIIVGIVGAGVAIGLHYYANRDATVSALVGVLLFCTLLSLIGFTRLNKLRDRLKKLEDGIRAHEIRMSTKLDQLNRSIPSQAKIDRLERKVTLREKTELADRNRENISARLAGHEEDTRVTTRIADIAANSPVMSKEQENVVPLRRKTDEPSEAAHSDEQAGKQSQSQLRFKQGFSSDGMHVRLQPTVELETQEVFAFEASACVTSRYGELHPDAVVRNALETDEDYIGFDKFFIDRVLTLVRSLRRNGKSPVVFVSISHASVKDGPAADSLCETLKANTSLNDCIILEVPQVEFGNYSSDEISKLRAIKELGFSLCITKCIDEDFAADTLGLGVFDFVKMPVTELEKIEASALTKPESEIMVACKNHDAKLIVTHVERERQAAHLIDHSIVYAQGDFFSPPKFPASNGASERKAK